MYKSISYGIGSSSSERIVKEGKKIVELLTDMYLDNWIGTGYIYANHNMCGSREQVCICEVDNFSGFVRIKNFANEAEIRKIYLFALGMVNMHNQISVVFDDVLNKYVKEIK